MPRLTGLTFRPCGPLGTACAGTRAQTAACAVVVGARGRVRREAVAGLVEGRVKLPQLALAVSGSVLPHPVLLVDWSLDDLGAGGDAAGVVGVVDGDYGHTGGCAQLAQRLVALGCGMQPDDLVPGSDLGVNHAAVAVRD